MELKLLAGKPIKVDGVGEIKQLKLKDIVEIGEDVYQKYLNMLCFDIKDLNIKEDMSKYNTFDVILGNCIYNNEFLKIVIEALTMFFSENVYFIKKYSLFCLKDITEQRFITRDNYDEIKKVLRIQNGLNDKSDKYNPANDKAKEIAERQRKAKEKINKIKAKNQENLNLSDLISAFAYYNNNVDITRIWDMTIYQFNDQFKRMQLVNEYEIGIQSLLQGADPNQVNIKHFVSKLK